MNDHSRRSHHVDPSGCGPDGLELTLRGSRLLESPLLNKGTAFTEEERAAFGLRGLVPPKVLTIEDQVSKMTATLRSLPSDLDRYVNLIGLMDRNETLFYRIVLENLEEMLPIIYTPTVGLACQKFSEIFRRGRGLYISDRDLGRVDSVLSNWSHEDVRLIVVTDGERILGLGDLGANGMGIPIGKLSLYVVAAGLSPWQVMPVCIDAGTENAEVREHPLYIGESKPRVRGERYDALIEEFVSAVRSRFPRCLLQFEDFAHLNSFRLLDRYRRDLCTFNDDMQGTGAVAYAGILSSQRLSGIALPDQRIVITGGGSAGIGISRQIVAGLIDAGLDEDAAKSRLWVLDSKGLITRSRPGLDETSVKTEFARQDDDVADRSSLEDVVKAVHPTVLIGVTGQPGLFSQALIAEMASHCERPLICALSNPTSKSECRPEDILRATEGRGLMAFGSPFPFLKYAGRKVVPGQGNNVYIFPGVGLGALAVEAKWLPDSAFTKAAEALAAEVSEEELETGCLYPSLNRIRAVSRSVAIAVAREIVRHGLSAIDENNPEPLDSLIDAMIWEPDYVPYVCVPEDSP